MKLTYKNNLLEKYIIVANIVIASAVTATFVLLFGFDKPFLPAGLLYAAQLLLLAAFITEKIIRFFNTSSKLQYLRANLYEIILLAALAFILYAAGKWFAIQDPPYIRHLAVGIYLVLQVVIKICRTTVSLAASGKNPTTTLIASFLVLILAVAGLLMLPRSAENQNLCFVDALFTATSATCVTGLIVKDTGSDFSVMGQIIILTLIQLGGLGIIVFGAVFSLLLGQALTVRESVAMQDLLSARTVSKIGNMIAFIFVATIIIEALGALALFTMWDNVPNHIDSAQQQWFCTIFHSVSAFCNSGFSLFSDSLSSYKELYGPYTVICPLIILGGLGFVVLYDLANILADKIKRLMKRILKKQSLFNTGLPKKMHLQSKIVLTVSAALILLGTAAILLLEHHAVGSQGHNITLADAFFQSVTARTAGFNTINIEQLSPLSRNILVMLMFVGGSPASAAGGIKTVTLAIVIMTAVTALRKRRHVEIFNRSIRLVVVGRAVTVMLLFLCVLLAASFALGITESANNFTAEQITFETASALGTVGLTCGITPFLTSTGKLIIIAVMLIGRLGPLTLLAALTFNIKPVRYSYPEEAIIVG